MPSPADLGLPEKFDDFRPVQEDMVESIVTSSKRVDGLCAPTGSGKSLAYIGYALVTGKPTCIVTSSKGLQKQLLEDFGEIGLVELKGRRNHVCPMKDDYTCEEGRAGKCPYAGSHMCPSSQEEMRAAISPLVVTNYAKWVTSRGTTSPGLTHIQQVVFDEAHHVPGAIADAMQVILHSKEVESRLGIDFLAGSAAENMWDWRDWASLARAASEEEMTKAWAKIMNTNDPKAVWVKDYNHLKNLTRRLGILATCRASDWVVDQVENGYQFDPVRPARYGEAAMFFRLPRIIMMSATIREKTLFMSGLGRAVFQFKEYRSEFDPKRCPIYYCPTQRVDAKNPDNSALWRRIDQIIARRKDRKGIIHTVSFQRQQELMSVSRFVDSMVINERGEAASDVVQYFKDTAPKGSILVSPSIGEGYDFSGDACRYQVLLKIPFEPPSKIVKAREADDPEYRSYQAMQSMVQAFGRGMRYKDDWCENFIGDSHMEWFKPRYWHLAPKAFQGFYREVQVLPQPLNFT